MAPQQKKGGSSRGGAPKGGSAKGPPAGKGGSKISKSSSSKSKKSAPVKKPTQQKTKSTSHGPVRKKKRVYTDKELGIPLLNSIKPAGIQKPHGSKKGKVFVDDKESMMAILAMVQAEKEGNIESKMMRSRQMEEIREARKAEAEKKEGVRRSKIEEKKDEIRQSKKNKKAAERSSDSAAEKTSTADKPKKKRVSFG